MKLLEVENLTVQYPGSTNPACKVSFQVESGELLGIAGASGAGKSTAMLSLMGILPEQVQITSEKLKQHGTKAMIFQDASASLNPLVRVGKQLTETILAHQRCTGKEARERAETLLDEVGIQDPGQRMKQYPFELSGGMKQRVAIAIALACNPDLIIADEPTTALDVTIQAQIIDLIKQLQQKLGTSVILITHDLGVVADIAHRIVVMYSGKVVEQGSSEDIFYRPKHPYTWALLKAVPRLDLQNKQQLVSIEGMPPDLITPPVGCPFAERCPHTMKICQTTPPPTYHFEDGHEASCWLHHPQCRKENLPFVAGGGQECQK